MQRQQRPPPLQRPPQTIPPQALQRLRNGARDSNVRTHQTILTNAWMGKLLLPETILTPAIRTAACAHKTDGRSLAAPYQALPIRNGTRLAAAAQYVISLQ